MGRTLPGQNLTPGSSHNSRETSSGLGAEGRKQFCPALHLSAPHHLGLESFHFSQDVCFIPSGSDSSLGGMHRAEGLPAPLPGLPGWGGERCSPDPASSGMAALRAPPCPSLSSPEVGEEENQHHRERPMCVEIVDDTATVWRLREGQCVWTEWGRAVQGEAEKWAKTRPCKTSWTC